MYQVMGEYGYSIEHILMVDIIPDPSVRRAMNEINAGNNIVFFTLFSSYGHMKQQNVCMQYTPRSQNLSIGF